MESVSMSATFLRQQVWKTSKRLINKDSKCLDLSLYMTHQEKKNISNPYSRKIQCNAVLELIHSFIFLTSQAFPPPWEL